MPARNSMFFLKIQSLILMPKNSVLEIQIQNWRAGFTFCVSIKGKKNVVFIFICQGFVSTPKGQVVWRSSLCSSYTSDEFIGTFRETTSNPSLLPTPFPLILSTPLSLHMKSTPAFLFPSASQFYLSILTSPIVLF